MRWERKPRAEQPKVGASRIVRKFLWLPKTLRGRDGIETRWLERAEIWQRAYKARSYLPESKLYSEYMAWADDHWVPE